MTHVTCSLTAKNRDQLRNPMLGNRVWATFTFYMPDIPVLHVEGSESPPITWFLGPTWVHTQNGTSIGLVILAQLMVVTNRHTHRPRNTGNNRPHLFSPCVWCSLIIVSCGGEGFRLCLPWSTSLNVWRYWWQMTIRLVMSMLKVCVRCRWLQRLRYRTTTSQLFHHNLETAHNSGFNLFCTQKLEKRLEMRDFSLCLIKKLSLIEK